MSHKKQIALFLFLTLLLFFLFPSITFQGCKNGLSLWLFTVLPSLFPFMLISNIILSLHMTTYVDHLFLPVCKLFFPVTSTYPLVIGTLSGYPMGAKTCNDLITHHIISKEEGQFFLSLCNNASPMFITCYIAQQCLHISHLRYFCFFIILLSGWIAGIAIFYLTSAKKEKRKTFQNSTSNHKPPYDADSLSLIQTFDSSIINCCVVLLKIGGYIVLFSILSEFIFTIPWIPSFHKTILACFFEITVGIYKLSHLNISLNLKIALGLAFTSFGGLSSIIQTKSVMISSRLSIKKYIIGKILQALLTFFLTLLLLYFLY